MTYEIAHRDHTERLARSAQARAREARTGRRQPDAAGRPPERRRRQDHQEWALSG